MLASSSFKRTIQSAIGKSTLMASRPVLSCVAPLALRQRRCYSSSSPSEANPRYKTPILLALGALALGSTIFSIVYQKRSPTEMVEGLEEKENGRSNFPYKDDISVVFVLGGPGSGKGTQSAKIVENLGFMHVCAGDLLRDEQNRPGSKYGELISNYIKEGLIVPQEVTVALLRREIERGYKQGKRHFLVDGFPRKMDQARTFEKEIAPSKLVLFFSCPETTMLERLLARGKSSGRSDDNIDSIKKRFKTFVETSMPVVRYFEDQGKVVMLNCNLPISDVYGQVEVVLKEKVLK